MSAKIDKGDNMDGYIGVKLKKDINVEKVYSVHYFEYPRNYSYSGERHNFWELVYADKGEILVVADDKTYTLRQGEIIFHKPNEWHSIESSKDIAPSIAVTSFSCNSSAMKFFENKIFSVNQEQKILISSIISEYKNSFSSSLNDPYIKAMERRKDGVFGGEQLLRQKIEELLISFVRSPRSSVQKSILNLNRNKDLFHKIEDYMLENLCSKVSVSDLVRYSGSNKTTISNVVQNATGKGVIEYFIHLKINVAKKYLREANYNISQIADILGYSSIHYFSRQFKNVTGMTPTEYSMSIQAIIKDE